MTAEEERDAAIAALTRLHGAVRAFALGLGTQDSAWQKILEALEQSRGVLRPKDRA